ncbi:hypothetical protein RUND412_006700 [Rhizina undulata]
MALKSDTSDAAGYPGRKHCLASPVFAQELPRILKSNPPPSSGPNYTIPLPDDSEAFILMSKILHFKTKYIPRDSVPFKMIAKVCISALRYGFADTIGPWMDRWTRPWLHTVGDEETLEQWLAIALICKNEEVFARITKQIFLNFTDDQIMTQRDIDAVLPPSIKAHFVAKRAVIPQMRYPILGCVVKGFLENGLFPIPDNGPYTVLTVIGVAEAMKNLDVFYEEGHQITCLEEMKAYLDKACADIDEILQTTSGLDMSLHVWSTFPNGSRQPGSLGNPTEIADVENICTNGQLKCATINHDVKQTGTSLGITTESITAAIDTKKQVNRKLPAVVHGIPPTLNHRSEEKATYVALATPKQWLLSLSKRM